ncbi:MAG TPA: M48 family metallopeptidase [Thermoanaerobaculia bacterium]|nr:M48 family metallopeptidase [Thermoanaerobaculia bacterium]
MKSARLSALAIVAVLITGCSSGGGFNMISLEEEWRLGQQLAADIERQMPVVRDQAANAYITQLGQRLVAQTPMANLPWGFHIIDSPEVNAFNIPGGHVYVTTGLIGAADNVAELAGVMAHEIAHGVQRHGTEQMSRAQGINILASVLLGQNPAAYQQILAQIVAGGAMASYGRDAERESDVLGTRWMHAAGYNPEGMASMFEELLARRQRSPGAVERFFSSHPVTESRIELVRSEIAKLPGNSRLVTNTNDYNTFRSRYGRSS